MPIEERLSKNDLNIRDFTLSTPDNHQELFFDVNGELTLQDWESIKKYYNDTAKTQVPNLLAIVGSEVSIIDPKHLKELQAENQEKLLFGYLKMLVETSQIGDALREAARLKLMFPEKTSDILKLFEPLKKQALQNLPSGIVPTLANNHLSLVYRYKILYPQEDVAKLHSPQMFDEYKNGLKNLLQTARRGEMDWADFVSQARIAKIFEPKILEQIDFKDSDIKALKDCFEILRSQLDKLKFCQYAAGLKILSAKQVFITESGVEPIIVYPKTTKPDKISMPQTKKF